MRSVIVILLFFTVSSSCQKNNLQQTQTMPAQYGKSSFTYLALGDSYTIGQSVPASDNYPNQVVSLLKKDSLEGQLKIIATTGWTTDDLQTAIATDESQGSLLKKYDIVTLLIGVNNQYHGYDAASYKPKFEELLKKAISLADNNINHVIVISIPDWGVTSFASGRDRAEIAKEIDGYNDVNKQLSQQYGVNYIDITPDTRLVVNDPGLLAVDGLHYSHKEYAIWAEKVAEIVKVVLR